MDGRPTLRSLAWMLTIVAASLGFSFGLACATPFAALAAVGGTQLRKGEAVGAALLAWLGNQAVGFLVLGYPHTWDTVAWGAAIGVAAIVAAVAVLLVRPPTRRSLGAALVAFAAAFVVYEGVIFAAGYVLPSEGDVFAPWIVARILEINAIAYAGLLLLHRVAVGSGLLTPPEIGAPIASRAGP